MRSSFIVTLLLSFAVLAGSCGSDGEDSSDATTTTTESPSNESDSGTDDADIDEGADTPSADYTPGTDRFRIVNLIEDPVDVYVRSSGIVEAWLVEPGLAPGAVSSLVSPPDEGKIVVLEAGATDATCVTECSHILAEASAREGTGAAHTVLIYNDFAGVSALDLWEDPDADQVGANAMPVADAAQGIAVITAVAVTDADFGMQTAIDGIEGCQEPADGSNIIVGGNQTPPFTYDGDSVDFTLYNNQDRECADDVYGGPFAVAGGAGTRSHVILTGEPYDLGAIVLPFLSDDGATGSASTSTDESDSSDASGAAGSVREQAEAFMAASMVDQIGLSQDQANCVAPYMVDAIGADVIIVDGEPIDLATIDEASYQAAQQALLDALEPCGIDPEDL